MKKSRIIIPALAMIAFSVAASITGTVAWFTANRTTTIDAGTYAVVKTTANLTKTLKGVVGTQKNNEDPDAIIVNGKLTDGSFDHDGSNNYIYAPDPTGAKIGSRVALATATGESFDESALVRGQTTDSTPKNIYTAVIWEVTFSMDFGAASGPSIGLFLDLANCSFTANGTAPSTGNKDTSKGFRMAFMPTNGGNTRVIAGLETAEKSTYVANEPAVNTPLSGTSGVTVEDYDSPILIDSAQIAAASALETSYTETAAGNMPEYLGKFTFAPSTVVSLTYDVVCWYEGTDENIVNSTETSTTVFRDVSVNLAFSAINLE